MKDDKDSRLDEAIKSKFRLFSGVRSQEEDQKIYDKVNDLCFDEMTSFLSENLNAEDQTKLLTELDSQNTDDDKTKVLQSYLSKIENYRFKLDKRLDYFLNNLLLSSVTTVNT